MYKDISPLIYASRHKSNNREKYMEKYWVPIILDRIKLYAMDKIVLDLGCGTGFYSLEINKYACQTIGIDIQKEWLSYFKKKDSKCEIILANAYKLPIQNKSVDLVVTIGLLEFVNRRPVLAEVSRTLRDNGVCIISVPNKYSTLRLIEKIYYKLINKDRIPNEPANREMRDLFKELQFEILEEKMDDGLIYLPKILDKIIGLTIYQFVGSIFDKINVDNPMSNIMLFIIKKKN